MISKKSKYAFKALMILADSATSQPILIADLAKQGNIPKKFLEFILLSLKKGGILNSRIGKGGGYSLALAANKITIGSIIRILEGDIAPVQCLSSTHYSKCDECQSEDSCGIRLTMVDVNEALTEILDKFTLFDMIERSKNAKIKMQNIVDFSI